MFLSLIRDEEYRKNTPFFLHDNVTRSLALDLESLLCKVFDQFFPGNDREFMRHRPLRPPSVSSESEDEKSASADFDL